MVLIFDGFYLKFNHNLSQLCISKVNFKIDKYNDIDYIYKDREQCRVKLWSRFDAKLIVLSMF